MWRVPVDGGQRTKVLEGLSSYLNLAIVDKGIYFVPDSGSSIQFLDLRTNQIRRIASFEKPVGPGDLGDDSGLAPPRMADGSCIRESIKEAPS